MKKCFPVDAVPAHRLKTRTVKVGSVRVGGEAPISVQTMTKSDTRDVKATVAQIRSAHSAGCDIIRVAVPDAAAAAALKKIVSAAPIPVIADIHFDHRLALAAISAGVHGLRINPGNIGARAKVMEVVAAAKDVAIPIRVGVNSGSLEKDLLAKYRGPTPRALVESALRHVSILEKLGHRAIKISVKASDPLTTIAAYRLLSRSTPYPLHLGVTEAGTFVSGTVRSSAALGVLLAEGIGDTIRISLADTPQKEVRVGVELLRTFGLRAPGASVIACPTCGRTEVDIQGIASEVEDRLDAWYRTHHRPRKPVVAVMGCLVNGPGEAKHADIAIAGGKHRFALYVRGQLVRTIPERAAVNAVLSAVRLWTK